jgi:hypothetical protein
LVAQRQPRVVQGVWIRQRGGSAIESAFAWLRPQKGAQGPHQCPIREPLQPKGTAHRLESFSANIPAGHRVWHTIVSGRHSPSQRSTEAAIRRTLNEVRDGHG